MSRRGRREVMRAREEMSGGRCEICEEGEDEGVPCGKEERREMLPVRGGGREGRAGSNGM